MLPQPIVPEFSSAMAFQEINVAVGLKTSCEPAFLIYVVRMYKENELHVLVDDFLQNSFLKNEAISNGNVVHNTFTNFPALSNETVSTAQDVWQGAAFTTKPSPQPDTIWMQAQTSLQINDERQDRLFNMSQHWAGIGYSKFHKYARIQIPNGYLLLSALAYQHTNLEVLLKRWPNCVFARSQWHAVADVQSGIHYMSPDKVFFELGIDTKRPVAVYEFKYGFRINPQNTWTCCLAFFADVTCPSMILLQPHPLNASMSQLSLIDFADFWKSKKADPFNPLDVDKVLCVLTPDTRKYLAFRESKRRKLNAEEKPSEVQQFISSVLKEEMFGTAASSAANSDDDVNRRKRRSRQLLFDKQHYALHAHSYFMPSLESVFYGPDKAQIMRMSDDRLLHVMKATMVGTHCTLSNPSQCLVFVSHAKPQKPRQALRMTVAGVDLCNMFVLIQQNELRIFVSAEEAEQQFILDIRHLKSNQVELRCRWNTDKMVGMEQKSSMDEHVTVLLFNGKHMCFGAWTLIHAPPSVA